MSNVTDGAGPDPVVGATAARTALWLVALGLAGVGALDGQGVGGVTAHEVRPTVVARADRLLSHGDVDGSLRLLEAYLAMQPGDTAARWRAARSALYLGILTNDEHAQEAWYRKAMVEAERALEARPDDPEVLRWAVAAEGKLALRAGVPERVHLASRVWRLDRRLLSIAPTDALAHDVLGTLEHEVMRLNGFQRVVGRMLGAGDLLSAASWEDALAEQRRAVALDPRSILYRTDLAATLAATGRTNEAVAQLRVAVRLPARLPVDTVFKASGRRRLARLTRTGGLAPLVRR